MKSSLLLKQAFFLGVTRALKDAGFDKTAISLYATPFAKSFQAPEQHSQMNLGDLVGSGHSARSPFASSLLKASAYEKKAFTASELGTGLLGVLGGAGVGAATSPEGHGFRQGASTALGAGLGGIGGLLATTLPLLRRLPQGWPTNLSILLGAGLGGYGANRLASKLGALESRVDPRPSGEFRQAPSAAPAALPKPEGPLTTDGWITTGQTTKEPSRNSPISLL